MRVKGTLIAAVSLVVTVTAIELIRTTANRAPDLTVQTVAGYTLSLTQLRGKPVLVTFWSTSCPSCVREIPSLSKLYDELNPRGLEIIAIAAAYDPPSYVLAMLKQRNIPYPIALDLDSAAARAFGNVRLIPSSFLISPEGRIVQRYVGEINLDSLHQMLQQML